MENKDLKSDFGFTAQRSSEAAAPLSPSGEPKPNVSATTPCSACGTTEPPDAAFLCPVKTCRAFRKGNTQASVHDGRAKLTAADLSARDELMARLFRERGGRSALDIVSQLRVEDYATAQIQLGRVTRRLESAGAVSAAGNERKSLVATYTTFSARVERLAAELPPPRRSGSMPSDHADIDNMADDEVIERLSRALKYVLLLRDARLEDPNDVPLLKDTRLDEPPAARIAAIADAPTTSEGAAIAPAPKPGPYVPECEYCRRRPCVGVDHVAYDVLHWNDPAEVKKRNEEATKEMLHQVGKPSPAWWQE